MSEGLELNIVSSPNSHKTSKNGQRRGTKIWQRKKNSREKRKNYERAVAARRNNDVSGVDAKQLKSHPLKGTPTHRPGENGSKYPHARDTTREESKQNLGQARGCSVMDGDVDDKDEPRSTHKTTKSVAGNARRQGDEASSTKSPVSNPVGEPSKKKYHDLKKSRLTATSELKKSIPRESVERSVAAKSKAESVASAACPTKRTRSSVPSAEPVVSDGVIDFTGRGRDHNDRVGCPPVKKNKGLQSREVAAAKGASMEVVESDAKWWDDDNDDGDVDGDGNGRSNGGGDGREVDDDLVHTDRVKSVRKLSDKSRITALGFDTGVRDGDGGLSSTKAPSMDPEAPIDLNAEASNAMGILELLLVRDAKARRSSSGREKSSSVGGAKNTDEDEMEAKHMAGDATTTRATESTTPPGRPHVKTVDKVPASKGTIRATAEDTRGESDEDEPPDETDHEVAQEARLAGSSASTSEGHGQAGTRLTRKTRGQGHDKDEERRGPLPEHHARPRELSRRAAAAPSESMRSAHVLARGPGATFGGLGLPQKMVSHLEAPRGETAGGGMGLSRPTVCQLDAVPVLMKGNNAVIKSETGSGKTLAYLLPLLCDLARMEPKVDRTNGTLAIVLAPTRELSAQIFQVLTCVGRPFIWLVPGCISGGERRKSEKARLRKGITVLVCTPGRLLDHLKTTKCFRRDMLRWLILDEADRLLDMGFEKQVKEIVELLDQSARAVRAGPAGARGEGGELAPSVKIVKRQAVMVSATLNKDVSRLAAALLFKHVHVDADNRVVESIDETGKTTLISGEYRRSTKQVAENRKSSSPRDVRSTEGMEDGTAVTSGEKFSTPRQLVQHYMSVTQKLRLPALCSFLRSRASEKIVVFMSTCDAVDFHHDLFRRARWPGFGVSSISSKGAETGRKGAKDAAGDQVSEANIDAVTAEGPGGEFFGKGCPVMRLHGNVPQVERQSTYRGFGAAKAGVLICTDVAARGLDLPTVDWIVQYDPPAEIADYVHRIGRTARKGERGYSLLFLLPKEVGYLEALGARGLRPKPLSLEGVLCAADAGKRDARRADEQLAYELQQGLQLLVGGDKALLNRARSAFQSHVRAYAARAPDSRTMFQVRSLHLGHVARSFALKDPPTAVKVGKRVVRRPGVTKDSKTSGGAVEGGGMDNPGSTGNYGERTKDSGRSLGKRRRDGGGGTGGGVRRLGLTKRTERASRAEFM